MRNLIPVLFAPILLALPGAAIPSQESPPYTAMWRTAEGVQVSVSAQSRIQFLESARRVMHAVPIEADTVVWITYPTTPDHGMSPPNGGIGWGISSVQSGGNFGGVQGCALYEVRVVPDPTITHKAGH